MKKSKWSFLMLYALAIWGLVSCSDWGAEDPPAGTDVYPTYSKVFLYNFNDEENNPTPMDLLSQGGTLPAVVADELAGPVLQTNEGYARFANPLNGSGLDKGVNGYAALTFLVKMPSIADEEGNPTLEYNRNTTLVSFQSMDGSQKLDFDANGGLIYDGPDGDITFNSIDNVKTGMLDRPDEWHSVAIQVEKDGYFIYVDGMKKVNENSGSFDMKKVASFMKNAPYIYINKGTESNFMLDDFAFYRGQLKDSDLKDKRPGAHGGGDDDVFNYMDGDWVDRIGNPDCTTGWWSEFSPYFRIPAEATLQLHFINHTSGGGNWNNWNLCLCTDAPRGENAEFVVIRSDLYGWGDAYTGAWTSEGYGDWDAFRADMEGADVTITVTRKGQNATIHAVAKCASGNVYMEEITAEVGTDVIRAFLIVDSSSLEMDKAGCLCMTPLQIDTPAIGPEDCSSPWWTNFSDYFTIPTNNTLVLNFENHTSGGGNWNNWNLCLCNSQRGEGDYAEYVVLRSDLYGWGDAYTGTWRNEGYGDWDAFRADMEGADVTITVTRKGENATIHANAICPNGNTYMEEIDANVGTNPINAFLIVDGSHLKMKSASVAVNVAE